jgi:hypothetical protein
MINDFLQDRAHYHSTEDVDCSENIAQRAGKEVHQTPASKTESRKHTHSSKASSTASIAQNKSLQLQSCSEIAHEAFECERSQKLRFAVNVLSISRRRDPRDGSAAYM